MGARLRPLRAARPKKAMVGPTFSAGPTDKHRRYYFFYLTLRTSWGTLHITNAAPSVRLELRVEAPLRWSVTWAAPSYALPDGNTGSLGPP